MSRPTQGKFPDLIDDTPHTPSRHRKPATPAMSPYAAQASISLVDSDVEDEETSKLLALAKAHNLVISPDSNLNTYDLRHLLYKAGLRWDKDLKLWVLSTYEYI